MYATEDKNLEIYYSLNDSIMGTIIPEDEEDPIEAVNIYASANDPDGEAIGRITVSDMFLIIVNTEGENCAGEVPTCPATLCTSSFTESKRFVRFSIEASTRIPFNHSAILSNSAPNGSHLPLAEQS